MIGTDDDTPAIDLAFSFFGAVLMLFVFVKFNFADAPSEDVPLTIGQKTATVEVVPAGWSPVNERGGIAVLSKDGLAILDLEAIGRGMLDPRSAYSAADAYQIFSAVAEPAPNAFSLTLTFIPDALPAPWVGETVAITGDDACPSTRRTLLTVFLPRDTGSLLPLTEFAGRCGFRLRLEPLAPAREDGTVTRVIALGAQYFRAESMFR